MIVTLIWPVNTWRGSERALEKDQEGRTAVKSLCQNSPLINFSKRI